MGNLFALEIIPILIVSCAEDSSPLYNASNLVMTKAFLSKENNFLRMTVILAEPDLCRGFYGCQLILTGN